MNSLNNSVIICESPKTGGKKIGKKLELSIIKKKGIKRTYYESPLKHIQQSKRFKALRSEKECLGTTQECVHSNTEQPTQDSIIVLSDTENDQYDQQEKKKTCNIVSVRNIQCNTLTATDAAEGEEAILCINKSRDNSNKTNGTKKLYKAKQKKSKVTPIDNNNSSCIIMSDINDMDSPMLVNMDDENTAPREFDRKQEAEEIAIVWSSMKSATSEKKKKKGQVEEKQEDKCNISEERNDRLFMIDCSPDKKNLACLNVEVTNLTITGATTEGVDAALPFSKSGMKLPKPRKKIHPQIKIADTSRCVTFKNSSQGKLMITVPNAQTSTGPSALSSTSTIPTIISKVITPTVPSITPSTGFPNTLDNRSIKKRTGLREIVIDGNNVAMAHTNGRTFSEMGLKLVVDYFKEKGHKVKAFVPQYRRSIANTILEQLHLEGIVVFTPSRYICGRKITPYDDRFILQYATMCEGIVVSSDQFRDLYMEKPEWRNTILNRLLAPTFVDNFVMFPEDPLGRNGPRLDEFLRY